MTLPGGSTAAAPQVAFVASELARVAQALETVTEARLTADRLTAAIAQANAVRAALRELRRLTFTAARCPLPALELLIAEMLAIHYCSDRGQTLDVLRGLLGEVRRRIHSHLGFFHADAARIFWVNPVADLQVMNLLEDCGGRLCGTDFMFCHALDEIPTDVPPSRRWRAWRWRIPWSARPRIAPRASSATHAATAPRRSSSRGFPGPVTAPWKAASCAASLSNDHRPSRCWKSNVPPVSDALRPALRTRLEALVETVHERRRR